MQRTHEGFRFEGLARKMRMLCAPQHVLLGAVLVLGWAALLAWTGNGSVGWQARLCADADTSLAACRGATPAQDGRVL